MILSKLDDIQWLDKETQAPASATAIVDDIELLIPMAGVVDKEAELSRLTKEIQKLNQDITYLETKLNQPTFINKAPLDIIQKEKDKLLQAQQTKEKLVHQQHIIEAL